MTSRRLVPLAGLVLLAALLSGCVGEPDPVETTPLFASEDEAFAAAEQTYRAYVDALNEVDLSDPATFEPVFEWTTGEFEASEREGLSTMHADGWIVAGESVVERISPIELIDDEMTSPSLGACLDVSGVTLTDAESASQVDPNRPRVQTTRIDFEADNSTPTGLAIADIYGYELDPPCSA